MLEETNFDAGIAWYRIQPPIAARRRAMERQCKARHGDAAGCPCYSADGCMIPTATMAEKLDRERDERRKHLAEMLERARDRNRERRQRR